MNGEFSIFMIKASRMRPFEWGSERSIVHQSKRYILHPLSNCSFMDRGNEMAQNPYSNYRFSCVCALSGVLAAGNRSWPHLQIRNSGSYYGPDLLCRRLGNPKNTWCDEGSLNKTGAVLTATSLVTRGLKSTKLHCRACSAVSTPCACR